MKKIIKWLLVYILIIFIIPSVFTKKRNDKENEINLENIKEESSDNINEEENYDYGKYNMIKLYHQNTGEVEELNIDTYLYGVVSSEMPADYEMEALKAQAIVARSYTIYQIKNSSNKHENADICDDYKCCQAWISKDERLSKWDEDKKDENWNKIVEAVDSTKGKIITYNGEVIDALFHANSGGITETAADVWGGTNFPYLQSVETSGEDGYSQYNSEVEISKKDLEEKLKVKYPNIKLNFNNENELKIVEYTETGRVKTMKFGNESLSGTEVRSLLGLKSTNFTFEINENTIKFTVIGYGHGVGMSQTGADTMAKNGASAEEIINHFYTGVEIELF